jgi:hypothetical protein
MSRKRQNLGDFDKEYGITEQHGKFSSIHDMYGAEVNIYK